MLTTDPRIKGCLRDLLKLERVVDKGQKAVLEVWSAVKKIHDDGLYLHTHETWEAYCRQRFNFTRQRGYQLLDFAQVSTVVDIDNERQARVLASLPPEVQRRVAARAVSNGDKSAEGLQSSLIELLTEGEEVASLIEKSRPERPKASAQEMMDMVLSSLRRARSRVPAGIDVDVRLRADIDRAIRTAESASF